MSCTPVSGEQHLLRSGDYEAVVAEVGASLRSLTCTGRDLVLPFDADVLRPDMRGAILAPWPNRTADGRYSFGGTSHQLPINELDTRTAAHGLVAWQRFAVRRADVSSCTLAATLEPQPGYPWRLLVEVTYALDEQGLSIEVGARNESASPAPFGVAMHPYLVPGAAGQRAADGAILDLQAGDVLLTDDRLLPTQLTPVAEAGGARFDYRSRRAVGAAEINHCYTSLVRDDAGAATVCVTDADGVGAEVSWDERSAWVQIYTADHMQGQAHRCAIAVEPSTCPPDALNSGSDLISIEPGTSVTAGWRISDARRRRPL